MGDATDDDEGAIVLRLIASLGTSAITVLTARDIASARPKIPD
jgi:hypothetical protein